MYGIIVAYFSVTFRVALNAIILLCKRVPSERHSTRAAQAKTVGTVGPTATAF